MTSLAEVDLFSPGDIRLPSLSQPSSVKTHASPGDTQEVHFDGDQMLHLQAQVSATRLNDIPASILQVPKSPDSPSEKQQSYAALSAGGSANLIPQVATIIAGTMGQTVRFNATQELVNEADGASKDVSSNPRRAFRLSGRKATPHPMIRRSMQAGVSAKAHLDSTCDGELDATQTYIGS